MTVNDYYDLLGLDPEASEKEIRAKIKEKKKTWTQRQNDPRLEQEYNARINLRLVPDIEAILLNPQRRASYDEDLKALSRKEIYVETIKSEAENLGSVGGDAEQRTKPVPSPPRPRGSLFPNPKLAVTVSIALVGSCIYLALNQITGVQGSLNSLLVNSSKFIQNALARTSPMNQVDELLLEAEALMSIEFYTRAERNAARVFQEVLEIDPGNQTALNGLQTIIARLDAHAVEASGKGKLEAARDILKRALDVPGDHSNVKDHLISTLSKEAAKLQAKGLLVQSGRNACKVFMEILAIDPKNQDAERGLQSIIERLLIQAEGAISKGNRQLAAELLEQATLVPGDHRNVERTQHRFFALAEIREEGE